MGKKGKAQLPANEKPKGKELGENNAEFEQMLTQLSQATSQNENLKSKAVTQKEHKKERKDKLKQIQTEKQEQAEADARAREQMMRFFEMLRKQQLGDFLEKANTEKEIETDENDDVRISCVAMQGWRQSMEDAHILEKAIDNGGEVVSIYGVFDGHSGSEVAVYTAANLVRKLKEQEGWAKKEYESALRSAFLTLDQEMLEKQMQSGSTATVCLVAGGKVYCANAGDSRAVMCVNGTAVALSEDHKPLSEVESARITKAGHTVQDVGGVGRVNGMLAVSRGFGDFSFKSEASLPAEEQPVTVNPDIEVHDVADTQFIIIACDGIWDSVSNDEIVAKTKDGIVAAKSPKELTALTGTLFDEIVSPQAGMIGSDNMSMVVIQFKKNCTQ